jgi:hypothetical protein
MPMAKSNRVLAVGSGAAAVAAAGVGGRRGVEIKEESGRGKSRSKRGVYWLRGKNSPYP